MVMIVKGHEKKAGGFISVTRVLLRDIARGQRAMRGHT